MAFWWVSQNKTFKHERDGGFIWAPLKDKRGSSPHHWENVKFVRAGDLIYSYVRGAIVAVGEAVSDAYPFKKPAGLDDEGAWEEEGRRVDVRYTDLPRQIAIGEFAGELAMLLPKKYSPLNENLRGVQGYLFALTDDAGRLLARKIGIWELTGAAGLSCDFRSLSE